MNLRAAAGFGLVEEVKRLLDLGAEIDEPSKPGGGNLGGYTALRIAVGANRLKTAELLLERGADPNLEQQHGRYPLNQAIRSGNMEMFCLLLKHGADPRNAGSTGFTALHHAAVQGRLTMCRILVEGDYGVDINAKDGRGNTPLAEAEYGSRTRVAEYLKSKGGTQ